MIRDKFASSTSSAPAPHSLRRWLLRLLVCQGIALSACGGRSGAVDGPDPVKTAEMCQSAGTDAPSNDGALLVLRVGGTEAGVTHDVLQVDGRARLGGRLQIVFEDGYAPVTDQKFTVVRATCIAGTFKEVSANKGVSLTSVQDSETFTVVVK